MGRSTASVGPDDDRRDDERIEAGYEIVLRPSSTGVTTLFFAALMEGAYITKVSTSGSEEGNVLQVVEMVFESIKVDYTTQSPKGGAGVKATFNWDIPAGTASPSA